MNLETFASRGMKAQKAVDAVTMKTPAFTTSIVITTGHRGGDNYFAKAWVPQLGKGLKATATSGEMAAARNLAVRYFFGGHTHAHGVGRTEMEAVKLTKLGRGLWRARLRKGGAH